MKTSDIVIPLTLLTASAPVPTVDGGTTCNGTDGTFSWFAPSCPASLTWITSVNTDPIGSYVDEKIGEMDRPSLVDMLLAMLPPSRYLDLKNDFIELSDQQLARKKVESAVAYFHNIWEFDSQGAQVCFLVPDMNQSVYHALFKRYEVICGFHPHDKQLVGGPYTHIGMLGTASWPLVQLQAHFLRRGSLWKLVYPQQPNVLVGPVRV